ncbi:MAG: DNA-nicking Smr family endonuclease [Bacteroidia bacterium]|jgi:DNA-nicking Smr family endonuclease
MMNGDDDAAFTQAMSDVVPLTREARVDIRKAPAESAAVLESRRAAAVADTDDPNHLTDTDIQPLDAWYVLEYKRPGVQNGVFRKLKQGRYEAHARLDLHRMTVERARTEIFEFLAECYQLGLRSVLMIHGKGQSRAEVERSSILKGCVNRWLPELEVVQAFHSAQPRHGGTGAVYVLLRKSEEKKRENREKFAKGRVHYEE